MSRNVILAVAFAASTASAQTPWRNDAVFQQIASRLDTVRAIDNHTHLLEAGTFDASMDAMMPLGLRSTRPENAVAMRERFGTSVDGTDIVGAHARATQARKEMVARLGEARYWAEHLDATRTDIALVNQDFREGTNGGRLRWVPQASTLLYPLPAESLMVRSSGHRKDIPAMQTKLRTFLGEDGLTERPPDLARYVGFIERTLTRWKQQGAVAVKFWDAYLRTLVFEDVAETRAAALYAKGLTSPLSREEYLALQDYLARRIFTQAGALMLPVHIHAAHGVPPFLRTQEADVRNLDVVLTDERYFGTRFVIIHGGAPLVEYAAYLALKPHVWYDMSAMPFLYAVPDLAQALRTVLLFAPDKLLFGTDVAAYPTVPVGADLQHVVMSRVARDAIALALAGLVRDGVVNVEMAVNMGENVLRNNALRLYGWNAGGAVRQADVSLRDDRATPGVSANRSTAGSHAAPDRSNVNERARGYRWVSPRRCSRVTLARQPATDRAIVHHCDRGGREGVVRRPSHGAATALPGRRNPRAALRAVRGGGRSETRRPLKRISRGRQ